MGAVLESLPIPPESVTAVISERPYMSLAGLVSVVTATLWWLLSSRRPKRPPPGPPNTIVVHGLGNSLDEPSISPFAVKLETYLKLAKLPYVPGPAYFPSRKGKIPWISYNSEEVADSQFCIAFVKEKFGVDLDKELSAEEKAVSHAFRVMMDEYHFWCNAYFRLYEAGDRQIKRVVPPYLLRYGLVRTYRKYQYAQGMGRHSESEIARIFENNLLKIEDYLGDKPFMMGEQPTEVDCAVFGSVCQVIFYPSEAFERIFGKDYIKKKLPKLYQLCMRIKERTYPDLPL